MPTGRPGSRRCCRPRLRSGEGLALVAADVVTVPSLDAPAATFAPTDSRSGRTFWIETTSEGPTSVGFGSPLLRRCRRRPGRGWRRPSRRRRVDVRSRDRADIERAERAAGELVPRETVFDAPVIRRQSRASSPSLRCGPTGFRLERSLRAAVEADRRDAALRDRRRDTQVSDCREHLQVGRRRRHGQAGQAG